MEEKDKELMTEQSTGPPLELVLPSTSHSALAIVADFVSSLAFNFPLCLSPINEKLALLSPPLGSKTKGKDVDRGPSFYFVYCQSSPPIGSNHGDHSWDKRRCATWHRLIEARGTSKILWWLKAKCTSLVGRGGMMDPLDALSPSRLG